MKQGWQEFASSPLSLTDVVGHLFTVAAASRTVPILYVMCALCGHRLALFGEL